METDQWLTGVCGEGRKQGKQREKENKETIQTMVSGTIMVDMCCYTPVKTHRIKNTTEYTLM